LLAANLFIYNKLQELAAATRNHGSALLTFIDILDLHSFAAVACASGYPAVTCGRVGTQHFTN
jgi:hypothetical protein